jgi:hypothetical protein
MLLSFSLVGCKDEEIAPMVLPKFADSFPDTTIYDIDKRILWIQTHVDGVSSSAADTMFKTACDQAKKNLGKVQFNVQFELNLAHKQVLIIGFNHFWVVWPVRNGVDYQGVPLNYKVMDYQMFRDWLTHSLGYMPTPDQIRVITLQDVQQTPKGQTMQLQTLAQLQQQKSQQPQEDDQSLSWNP